MAKIYDVELKAVKNYVTATGLPVFQGKVYWKKKAVGSYTEDPNGGSGSLEVPANVSTEIEDAIRKYYAQHPRLDTLTLYREYDVEKFVKARNEGTLPYRNTEDQDFLIDFFFDELICLSLFEKDWKKAKKKGFSTVVIVEWVGLGGPKPRDRFEVWQCDGSAKTIEEIKAESDKIYPAYILKVYEKAEDFIIAP